MKRLLAMAAAMMAAAAAAAAAAMGAATFGDVDRDAPVVLGAGETNVQAMASARAVTNIAETAAAQALNSASNTFLRVIQVSPGVWQHKLPGE